MTKLRVRYVEHTSIEELEQIDDCWFLVNNGFFCTFDYLVDAVSARDKSGGMLMIKSMMVYYLEDISNKKKVPKEFYNPQQI